MLQTLWDGNHPRQAEYEALWDKYVPASGAADTRYGNVLRAYGRLIYDYYNNGFCNALERGEITPFYSGFINDIHHFGYRMDDFRKWMVTQNYYDCDFDDRAAEIWNDMAEYILNNHDKLNH